MQPNVKLQDDASENSGNEEFQVNDFQKSDIVEKARTDDDSSDEPNVDSGEYNTYYSSGEEYNGASAGRKTIPAAGAGEYSPVPDPPRCHP